MLSLPCSWVKCLAQDDVQVMYHQRELSESVGLRLPSDPGLHARSSAFKAQAEGETFVYVTEFMEETADLFGLLSGKPDGAQGSGQFNFAFLDCLEEGALELTAASGPTMVNPATVVGAQSSARLREFRLWRFVICRATLRPCSEPNAQ
jgi:hypothetical protein